MAHAHRSPHRPWTHPRGVLRPSRSRPDRAPSVRQDHSRTRRRRRCAAEHLPGSRERGGPATPADAGTHALRPVRARGHRRDPARAGDLRDPPRPRGSRGQSGALSRARQRIPVAGARRFGVAGGACRDRRPVGVLTVGDRTGCMAHPVAPGRVPARVPRPARACIRALAAKLRADFPRARHAPARHHGPRGDSAPLLDDDRPLSWPGVERGGVRPGARLERSHGATLSRHSGRFLHGACSSPVVRQRQETPGQVAQGLPARHRAPAHAPHAGHERRPCGSPESRRLLRGLFHRADPGRVRVARCVLLGDARGRRARPARDARRPALRLRVQARRCPRHHAIHARCNP